MVEKVVKIEYNFYVYINLCCLFYQIKGGGLNCPLKTKLKGVT